MRVGRDRKRDLFQMKRHGLAVEGGEDEPRAFSIGRTDGAEDIGRCRPLIMRRGGACSTLGPAAGGLVFFPPAGLLPGPKLYLLSANPLSRGFPPHNGEAFF